MNKNLERLSMPNKKCAKCGIPNPDNANFCHQCGWRVFEEGTESDGPLPFEASATNACPMCSVRQPEGYRFCTQCGYQLSEEETVQQGGGYPFIIGAERTDALLLSSARLIILSALSLGLYFYYWTYLTWKHLQSETEEVHYPVWHALSLLVPIYGLFRIHKHTSVIRDLAAKSGIETSLNPDLVFVLMLLNTLLGLAPLALGNSVSALSLFIGVIGLVIGITVIVWAQAPLNGHWQRSRSESLSNAPVNVWEIVIVLLGLAWYLVIPNLIGPA